MVYAAGLLFTYYNIFGTICKTMMIDLFQNTSNSIFEEKFIYILVISVAYFPTIFKREMHELKIVAYLLFISCIIFLTSIFLLFIAEGTSYNASEDLLSLWNFKFERETITSVSIFAVAYTFQFNLFSTYASLQEKTTE